MDSNNNCVLSSVLLLRLLIITEAINVRIHTTV